MEEYFSIKVVCVKAVGYVRVFTKVYGWIAGDLSFPSVFLLEYKFSLLY